MKRLSMIMLVVILTTMLYSTPVIAENKRYSIAELNQMG